MFSKEPFIPKARQILAFSREFQVATLINMWLLNSQSHATYFQPRPTSHYSSAAAGLCETLTTTKCASELGHLSFRPGRGSGYLHQKNVKLKDASEEPKPMSMILAKSALFFNLSCDENTRNINV